MPGYKYLMVGGGMTADSAARAIREIDPDGTIGLISSEQDPPYERPPLSKGLWKGEPLEAIWRGTEALGVSLHLGRTVMKVDPRGKRVEDDQGTEYTFDKLLLATGGTPRRLPFGGDQVIYYRTLADYRRLRSLADQGRRFAIIGGGFIGSEVAAALAMNGKDVVMVFPEPAICSRIFPADVAGFLNDHFRQRGIEVMPARSVVGLDVHDGQVALATRGIQHSDEEEVLADAVVAGIGLLPNVELAQAAGLQVGKGIEVDEHLRTSHPDIFAAGDVAAFHNPALGRRIRVEHEDNALFMGKLAGRSMAGQGEPYHRLPAFYSDLFELGYNAVGDLDPRLDVVADWKDPYRAGVLYYMEEGRVRGVLLWNVAPKLTAARRLIAEPGPFQPEDLKGRLP